ncbi:MAG TPA: matrixin family metalloprotease [Gemmatimonadales bacterium]|jgi:predicted Zn-dependent protease|nr:matrixin family metalloprotease [Gemmatimonadales bacterium]
MERRLTGMIAAAAVLIVLFIIWDIFRPNPRPIEQSTEPLRTSAGAPQPAPASSTVTTQPAPPPGNASSEGGAIPTDPNGRQPSYFELLARSETRRRIRASGTSTYLGDMLEASGDSMLRRWENRQDSPIRVWFVPTHAANFQPAFLDAIRTAFTKWVDIGVPVRFTFDADSTNAEVTVKWRIQFEIERTGQTDVTWDENGHIQSAVVTLATFDSKGEPMTTEDVRVVAEHEIGHVLGLDHSRDSTDLMFPMAKVRDLSDRDTRTVLLLYQLTPGSLR